MKITPQDIIDKEFRVKFRGFDMAEVDAFLEEVAEVLFKLSEENTLLNEKVLAMQDDLQRAGSGPAELPEELGSTLEDLKQDTAAISAELAALKQDKSSFDALEKNTLAAIASIQETVEQQVFPADLADNLAVFKEGAAAVSSELTALQEGRRTLESLQKDMEHVIETARDLAAAKPTQQETQLPDDLVAALDDFKQGTETVREELAAMKKEISSMAGMRDELKKEIQELFISRFAELETKLAAAAPRTYPPPATEPSPPASKKKAKKKEELAVAEVIHEPAKPEEDTRLPDYRVKDEEAGDGDLEFLSEDDILDVDRLRGIFQSALDDGISDSQDSREEDEATAELLFIEDDDLIEEEHEPEVTYGLEENETGKDADTKNSAAD